jgi:hypothetical protein
VSSVDTRFIVGGLMLLHGLGHGGALGALIWLRVYPASTTGGWTAARSWLFPSLAASDATVMAAAFWIVALLGFVAAALSFWGVVLPEGVWREVAVGSALVSLAGMTLFLGNWPVFNTLAALAVNAAVLVTQLITRWPSAELLGR